MKKFFEFILDFFIADKNIEGHLGDENVSARCESICGFILFLLLPCVSLIWYNISVYDDLKIIKKDEQIINYLDNQIPEITKMKDSIRLNKENSLIDTLEKNIKFAKVKTVKKYGGYWYNDTKTSVKTDDECVSACKSEFFYKEDLKNVCLGKCIKITKYNTDEYQPIWYDTIWTDGVVLRHSVTKEQYIKNIAVDSAKIITLKTVDSLKTNLIKNSGLENTQDRLISYDEYSKEYLKTRFENFYGFNIVFSTIIIIYLICLLIRFLVIRYKIKKELLERLENTKEKEFRKSYVLTTFVKPFLINHGIDKEICEKLTFEEADLKIKELNLSIEFFETLPYSYYEKDAFFAKIKHQNRSEYNSLCDDFMKRASEFFREENEENNSDKLEDYL